MRILCFGDSNTYGYDPRSQLGDRYEAENRWPDILAERTGWEVINVGQNGREIPSHYYMFQYMEELLVACGPVNLVIVMLGTNDILQSLSAEEAAGRMDIFLSQTAPFCGQLMLIAPPALKRCAWVERDALVKESRLMAKAYCTLAEKLDILFADAGEWNLGLAFDGVHFSEEDHKIFARELVNVLRGAQARLHKQLPGAEFGKLKI